jgi:hypothetical protein
LASELAIQLDGAADTWFLKMHRFLLDANMRGQTVVALFDEAQDIPVDVLEEIRLLTNIETSTTKLLQVILVGQPELDKLLDSHQLRALRQRIALRHALTPLTLVETRKYIENRVTLAGGDPLIFDPAACQLVHRYSAGVPRVINLLCENCLIAGYASDQKTINRKLVRAIAVDMHLIDPDADSAIEVDGEESIAEKKPAATTENLAAAKPRVSIENSLADPAVRGSSGSYSLTPPADARITAVDANPTNAVPALLVLEESSAVTADLSPPVPDANADSAVNTSVAIESPTFGAPRSSELSGECSGYVPPPIFGETAVAFPVIDHEEATTDEASLPNHASSLETDEHSDATPFVQYMHRLDPGPAPWIMPHGTAGPTIAHNNGSAATRSDSEIRERFWSSDRQRTPDSNSPYHTVFAPDPDAPPKSGWTGVVAVFALLAVSLASLVLLSQESLGASAITKLVEAYLSGIF